MAEKKPLCNYGGEVRELQSGDSLPSSFSVVGNNLLINSAGLINQRGYVSGTATTSANQYTLDRWRVVTSGDNLSFSTSDNITTFTAPSGGVEQVIGNLNIQGGSYVLSFDGTATAEVAQSADNSTYTVVTATDGVYTITPGYYVRIRFLNGTFSKPKFEIGSTSTKYALADDKIEKIKSNLLNLTAAIMFNGITPEIFGQYNIASLVKIATGQYTVTFNSPMDNTHYLALATGGGTTANALVTIYGKTTTQCTVRVYSPAISNFIDDASISFMVFGGRNEL